MDDIVEYVIALTHMCRAWREVFMSHSTSLILTCVCVCVVKSLSVVLFNAIYSLYFSSKVRFFRIVPNKYPHPLRSVEPRTIITWYLIFTHTLLKPVRNQLDEGERLKRRTPGLLARPRAASVSSTRSSRGERLNHGHFDAELEPDEGERYRCRYVRIFTFT